MALGKAQASRRERRVITGRVSQIPAGLPILREVVMDLALVQGNHRRRLVDMALALRPVRPPAPLRTMATGLAPVP